MIALQARNPQLPDPSRQTAQFANMMNMARQQEAAMRQASLAQQTMDINKAQEARAAALQPSALAKAEFEAEGAGLKTAMDFFNTSEIALANSRNPQQAMALGERIKQLFPRPEFQQSIDQTLASIPEDPAQFEAWRKDAIMRTLEGKDQVSNEFINQNLGTSTRTIRAPKFGSGAAEVVEGSEAAVDIKPTVVNVEGVGPVIVDPNSGQGFAVTAGAPGGYTPPGAGGSRGVAGGEPAKGSVAAALRTNPGALKDGGFAKSQTGYTGASGGFATFKTPEDGIRAQENLLRNAYVGKGFNTIDKIINRYAPQGPENSAASVSNYKKYVARKAGVDINAPISPAQIPVVAQAMREFETGNTSGGGRGTAGAGTGAPKTFQQVETEKGFKKTLDLFEYNAKTGEDTITPLIKASTSGGLEKLGSEAVGFLTGEATPGRVALEQLASLKDNMTFEKLRGKLGAQISDADVRLVASTMGDIANADIPANARAAKWKNVVLPILVRGAGLTPVTRGAAPKGAAPKTATLPTLTPEQVRANPKIKRWKTTDGRVMVRK
jgi:hypothetical protein